MRTIRKEIVFGRKPGQKLYHESYGSYQEFYDTLMTRQPNARQKLEEILDNHNYSWVGVSSVEEAKKLLLTGWDKPLENLKVLIDKELKEIDRTRTQKMFNNVAGFMPIIPNALMGLPKSMIDIRQEHKKTKILRFMISIDRGCGNDVSTIIKKMSKMLAQIASLEKTGQYRCRIEVFFTAFDDYHDDSKTYTSCSVLVKSENQLFDTKRLCYPIVHPSMLRLLMFGWEESIPLKEDYYVSGYGCSFEHWSSNYQKEFVSAITENGEKIITCDLNTDLEYTLKNY